MPCRRGLHGEAAISVSSRTFTSAPGRLPHMVLEVDRERVARRERSKRVRGLPLSGRAWGGGGWHRDGEPASRWRSVGARTRQGGQPLTAGHHLTVMSSWSPTGWAHGRRSGGRVDRSDRGRRPPWQGREPVARRHRDGGHRHRRSDGAAKGPGPGGPARGAGAAGCAHGPGPRRIRPPSRPTPAISLPRPAGTITSLTTDHSLAAGLVASGKRIAAWSLTLALQTRDLLTRYAGCGDPSLGATTVALRTGDRVVSRAPMD